MLLIVNSQIKIIVSTAKYKPAKNTFELLFKMVQRGIILFSLFKF